VIRYVLRRILLIIPTMFFVALITFSLAHLAPGNPFDRNDNRPLPQSTIDRLNSYYGFDRPLPEQFVIYLGNLLRGDLGTSLTRGRPVAEIILQGAPATAQIGIQALLLALIFSIPLGIVSALRQNSVVDYASILVATVGTTIPGFVTAIFLIYLFGVTLHLLPFIGWGTWQHTVMPTVVLALGPGAFLTRITRASVLEAIHQDYVRTARGKGLREGAVIVGHVLKNALIPVATILGPAVAGLITGSFIIETLFNVPGIGRLYVISINQRDYPMIMSTTLLYAFLIMLANLTVDFVYGALDPRAKVG
jgi:ABC-type dipeptide/oligopeptide/nickel transport system permease component